jgi:hypothetical protein
LTQSSSNTPNDTDQTSRPRHDGAGTAKGHSSVTWGITIISAVTLILTLLGYGVALAVETTFGLPHQTVYASALDLIGLSVYAIISAVLGFSEVPWLPLLRQTFPLASIAAAGIFMVACCAVFLKVRAREDRRSVHGFWAYFSAPTPNDSNRKLLGKGAIWSGLCGAVTMITPFLLVFAVMVTVVLISIVPIFGMQLGGQYLHKFVVSPTACAPLQPRSALLQARTQAREKKAATAAAPVTATATATCVTVYRDDKQVASGRLVVATSSAVILFEPVSGTVHRVPIGDATVLPVEVVHTASERAVDAEKPPAPSL